MKDYEKHGEKGYPLTPGNIIKLGRIEFLVLEYRDGSDTVEMDRKMNLNSMNGILNVDLDEEE